MTEAKKEEEGRIRKQDESEYEKPYRHIEDASILLG
jgi:hypothetical protein